MPYSDIKLKQIKTDFGLDIIEQRGIFSNIAPMAFSDYFAVTLEENLSLAIAINTEKARSELLVANVLLEIRKQFERKISFFSGIEFNVDKEKNLNGFCDFIVSLSAEQLFLQTPVIALVEAKNENIMSGLGECIAEMLAAQLYNRAENTEVEHIYGAVTSGIYWKFIRLTDKTVSIDLSDYSLENNPEKIIGILSAMIKQAA